MITLWAFFRRRFRHYSRALRHRSYAKGPRPTDGQPAGKIPGEERTRCTRKLSDDGNVEKLTFVPTQDPTPIFSLPDHSSLIDSSSASEGHSAHNAGSFECLNSASRYFPGSLPTGFTTHPGPPWNFDSVVPTTSTDVRPLPPLPGQDRAEGISNPLGGSHTPSIILTAVHPSFWPLAPEQIQRYEREVIMFVFLSKYLPRQH